MNEATVTITGNVATEIRHVVTDAQLHITSFRLASTPSRFDKGKGGWVDGPTSWYTVSCFRFLAQNVAASLRKGDPVVVTGTLRMRDWRQDERSGTNGEIDAQVVGHDLSRGITQFRKVTRTRAVRPEEDEVARRALAPGGVGDVAPGVDPLTGELLDQAAPEEATQQDTAA